MIDVQSTLQPKIIDLAGDALSGFCEDIGGMFGVDMSCQQSNVNENAIAEVKKNYKKVAAVYSVKSSGSINGGFKILFDKAGLFTLAGVVVMLPESRILSNAKRGTLADTGELSDAVGEVGNLLVGCWGRIFRDGLKDNTHFTHTGTFIGDICAEDNGILDLASGEEATFVSYDMTVGEYPSFKCGLYLPSSLFDEVEEEPVAQSEPDPEVQESRDPAPTKPEVVVTQEEKPVAMVDPVAVIVEEEPAEVIETESPEATGLEAESELVVIQAETPSKNAAKSPEPVEPVVETSVATNVSATVAAGIILLAKHLMQTQLHWACADDTVGQAQTQMQQLGVSYLLVGNGAKLEGIVTQSDLASAVSIYLRPIFAKWRRPEDDATLQIRLKWIMSKQIYAVKAETPLNNILHLKCKYSISYLPVVDVQGHVLGVVTAKDIFKAIINKELDVKGVTVT